MPKITFRQQYRTVAGKQYGPYWYGEWKEGKRVRTRYYGKERPAEAGTVAELNRSAELFDAEARTRECWLLLGYPPDAPPAKREQVRKRVFNLVDAKTRPEGIKREVLSAWEHLRQTVWPDRNNRPTKKGAPP